MLSAALEILDRKGADALTMRGLAARLGVNPMTIHYHFGDRDGLIRALAERAYARVVAPKDGDVRERLEGLLTAYRSEVLRRPGLTLAIFSRPAVFPDQARRITEDLEVLLRDLGLPQSRSRLWVAILVDFIHGAALAEAMSERPAAMAHLTADARQDDQDRGLAELLDGLARSV